MNTADRIHVDPANPRYFSYRGQRRVLLGGTREDNIFQIPELEEHFDLLKSVGGNYARCTISCRDEGDVWPYLRLPDGKYDLKQWNPEFWRRFELALKLASERDIILQIEFWDQFDYVADVWDRNPLNPKNNINLTYGESGLPEAVGMKPPFRQQTFFWTTEPGWDSSAVLAFQHRQMDAILERTLPYGNVLYCMDNETHTDEAWGIYWANRVREKAEAAGQPVEITQMYWQTDLRHPAHYRIWGHPETYSFVEISQNSAVKGQASWDRAVIARNRLSPPRPMTSVKLYGASTHRIGVDQDGIERFWRHLLAGSASVRFHRPPHGIGLGAAAQHSIKSARMLAERIDLTQCEPQSDGITPAGENLAHATVSATGHAAIYFPAQNQVTVDLTSLNTRSQIQWLHIDAATWSESASLDLTNPLSLTPPTEGNSVAVIEPLTT